MYDTSPYMIVDGLQAISTIRKKKKKRKKK